MALTREGKERSFQENLILAHTLPGVAGMVNVIGYLNLGHYTSHVTGRISGFAVNVSKFKIMEGLQLLGLAGCFLLGAMLAAALIEFAKAKHLPRFQVPLLIEALLLSVILAAEVAQPGPLVDLPSGTKVLFAMALAMSMGLQNALVARLSGAVVRTTHLTGLSTDLGIELVRVIRWYVEHWNSPKHDGEARKDVQLYRVRLYLTIMFTFATGAVVGGLLNNEVGVLAMMLPILILVALVIYDRVAAVSEEDVGELYNPKFDEKQVAEAAIGGQGSAPVATEPRPSAGA